MAVQVNVSIDQGSTFEQQFMFVHDSSNDAIDLSGYSANASMKKTYTSNSALEFVAAANSSGILVISMDASTTALAAGGRYVYDVLVTAGGVASRLVEGSVFVDPQVSA